MKKSLSSTRLPAVFWWICGGMFVNALASFIIPFLAMYLRSRSLDVGTVGTIVSMYGCGKIMAGPIGGWFTDRVGRRPTLFWALCGTATCALMLSMADSPWLLALGVLGYGLCDNSYRPAAFAAVADAVPQANRARAWGVLYGAVNCGIAVASTVGGALAAHGWWKLFAADATTTLFFAVVVWRNVPESHLVRKNRGEGQGAHGFGSILGDRVFVGFVALQFLFLVLLFQFQVALPIDMADQGMNTAQFGRAIALNAVLIVATQPLALRLHSRFGSAYMFAIGCGLVGSGLGLYSVSSEIWHWYAATAIWSMGEALVGPFAAAAIADLSPPELRGRYHGVYSVVYGVATIVAPMGGAAVLVHVGSRLLWSSCFAVGLVAGLGHLALGPHRRRRAAESAVF